MNKVLVIGAANVDIIGVSKNELINQDSNPGTIGLSVGGVAKNIAENLKRLDIDVSLLTVFGNDSFSAFVKADLDHLKIDYSLSLYRDQPSGKFLSIHDPSGNRALALNDFGLLDELTPELFYPLKDRIEAFDYLVLDTNLPEQVLIYLINTFAHKPIIVDAVSSIKVVKLKSIIHKISLLKVNQHELSALLGREADDIILALRELVRLGLKQAVVTNGSNPITYNIDKSIYQTFIFEARKHVSSIGCGDALLSGTIYGIIANKTMHESINYGKKAASLTMEVATACHPELSRHTLED